MSNVQMSAYPKLGVGFGYADLCGEEARERQRELERQRQKQRERQTDREEERERECVLSKAICQCQVSNQLVGGWMINVR